MRYTSDELLRAFKIQNCIGEIMLSPTRPLGLCSLAFAYNNVHPPLTKSWTGYNYDQMAPTGWLQMHVNNYTSSSVYTLICTSIMFKYYLDSFILINEPKMSKYYTKSKIRDHTLKQIRNQRFYPEQKSDIKDFTLKKIRYQRSRKVIKDQRSDNSWIKFRYKKGIISNKSLY